LENEKIKVKLSELIDMYDIEDDSKKEVKDEVKQSDDDFDYVVTEVEAKREKQFDNGEMFD